MSDLDFLRIASLFLLPRFLEMSENPVIDAVDLAEELLKECQKRENL